MSDDATTTSPPASTIHTDAESRSCFAGVDMTTEKDSTTLDMTDMTNTSAINGTTITFSGLSYEVTLPNGTKKRLLSDVDGAFSPGKLTALMGPSGSGKSTLLDVLSGRKNQGTVTGSVLYNGEKVEPEILKRMTGYVEQFDTLVVELTVYQMLMYTAELKLGGSLEDKEAKVDSVIKELSLTSCRDTVIGSNMDRGVSGGEAN